nr:hypothetical protein Csa_6G491035 [Ipomoea batatas]GMC59297.1 hypothetical protein Csa_6G491035 [Ipomoea batatas]
MEGVNPSADFGGLLADIGGGEVGEAIVVGEKLGEVEAGGGAAEIENGGVVSPGGGDGGGIRAEPNPGAFIGLANLRHPFPPLPHANPPDRIARRTGIRKPWIKKEGLGREERNKKGESIQEFSCAAGNACPPAQAQLSYLYMGRYGALWKSTAERYVERETGVL